MKKIFDRWKIYENKNSRKLIINHRPVYVEVADDMESQTQGLQHRHSMEADAGMLFVYDEPKKMSFWMKDTYIPLSIAFIDSNGKIVDIQYMEKPLDDKRSFVSKQPCLYALEVNHGWFAKNHIRVGNYVRNLP
tara:strand:+ start:94 stop:495 length:402 start_codon:yes stop_codon:yes gene_type:complete